MPSLRGFLSEVTGFAADFHYKLGGMLHKVHHANGVTSELATAA